MQPFFGGFPSRRLYFAGVFDSQVLLQKVTCPRPPL